MHKRHAASLNGRSNTGFTIVELLIVIVVIGILAAVVTLAYSGIQQKARTASFTASLRNAASKVESEKTDTGYPATMTYPNSGSTTFVYTQIGSGAAYCLEATSASTPGMTHFISQQQKARPGPCPLAYWSLGGTASGDDSPYRRDGTTTSSVGATNDRFGSANQATVYNASGRRTLVASPVGQAGVVTASVWYKRDEAAASTSWRTILGHASANVHHLIVNNTSRNIGIFDGSWRDFGYLVPDDGQWHHYAVIYNVPASNATLYVDGVQHATIATTLNLATSPIGSIGEWGGGSYWAGPVDDVSIYGRALTTSEIQYLASDK